MFIEVIKMLYYDRIDVNKPNASKECLSLLVLLKL